METSDLTGNRNVHGFTLAEILIATSIFAIVMTMLFSSFNASITNTEMVHGSMTTSQMAENCINRITSDLHSIYLNLPPAYQPPDINAPPDPYRLEGETDSINGLSYSKLRFTSTAHLSFGQSENSDGIAEIVYYVDQTDKDMWVIRRGDKLYPYEEFEIKKSDPVLCEKIKSLAFVYYDAENGEHEVWDSESLENKYATPRAIGVSLEIGNEDASQIYKTKIALPVYRDKIE
jgi:prepilin-type N-terminal cleavage/methylation domain-containing protein